MSADPGQLGRNVAAARVAQGLKPKQLAKRLGVDPAKIYRLERGARKTVPDFELDAIATALGVTRSELLRDGQPAPPAGPDLAALQAQLHELAQAVAALPTLEQIQQAARAELDRTALGTIARLLHTELGKDYLAEILSGQFLQEDRGPGALLRRLEPELLGDAQAGRLRSPAPLSDPDESP